MATARATGMTAEAVRRGCAEIAASASRADGPPTARAGRASQAAKATSTGPSKATATMHVSSSGNASASCPAALFWPNVNAIRVPAPPAAPRPSRIRTGLGHLRSATVSRSACAGEVRPARRAAICPLSTATITLTPHATSSSHGLRQAAEPAGSIWCAASACTPTLPSATAGSQPSAPPTTPHTVSSVRIARRTWPRVAPTVRSSANRRRRRLTARPVVAASTNSEIVTIGGMSAAPSTWPSDRSTAAVRSATSPRAEPVAIV